MGAKNYKKNLLIAYIVYLSVMVCFRVGGAIYNPEVFQIVFSVFSVFVTFWIIHLTIKLYNVLGNLNQDKLLLLRTGYQPGQRDVILF